MRTFDVQVSSADQSEQFSNVCHFFGRDETGAFGIMAGHERFMTICEVGTMRLRQINGSVIYIALVRGVLYFCDNTLKLITQRFMIGNEPTVLVKLFADCLNQEAQVRAAVCESVRSLERSMIRQLWSLEKSKT